MYLFLKNEKLERFMDISVILNMVSYLDVRVFCP
jgi:hypothetical protein